MNGPLSRYLSIYDQSTYLDQRTLRDGITVYTFCRPIIICSTKSDQICLDAQNVFYLCGVPRITYQSNSNYLQKETTKWASYMLMMIAPRGLLIICLVLVGVFGRKLERGWLIISK